MIFQQKNLPFDKQACLLELINYNYKLYFFLEQNDS
jgi:hypothetical protein